MSAAVLTPFALELDRHFDAQPEAVFDAWLSKEWGRWLPPAGATCTITEISPRPGGSYHLNMPMGDGRQVEIAGQYREIIRPKKIVLTWIGNYNNQETVISLTFRPDGGGTLMTLRQEGFHEEALRDGYRAGWTSAGGSFDKLEAFLKG
jgi:uncharacterized protein YndB with AHSA1/START domain